jgi:hypothetical protein
VECKVRLFRMDSTFVQVMMSMELWSLQSMKPWHLFIQESGV